jgi:acetyl esterase/lipase
MPTAWRRLVPLAAATALSTLAACGGGSQTPPPAVAVCGSAAPQPVASFAYREDAATPLLRRSLDVHAPVRDAACPAAPVVVHFHGGGYVTGDKAQQIGDKAALFVREGWVFVSVNYRLSPYPVQLDNPARIRYPAAQNDAAAALAWLRDQAAALRIDPSRLMVMGHSAGAHLAALISSDPSFLAAHGSVPPRVRCTVALDTEAYDLVRMVNTGTDDLSLYQNAVGTDEVTLRAASPREHASAGDPPHLIVTRGEPARQAQARDHAAALSAAGVAATTLVATGYTHEQVNAAVGAAGETVVTPALMDFLRGCAR